MSVAMKVNKDVKETVGHKKVGKRAYIKKFTEGSTAICPLCNHKSVPSIYTKLGNLVLQPMCTHCKKPIQLGRIIWIFTVTNKRRVSPSRWNIKHRKRR